MRGVRKRWILDDSLAPVARPGLSFDLVVATLGRSRELDALLTSLDAQSHGAIRVLVVDQNDDDRVARVVDGHPGLEVVRVRSERGLSRARNAALPHVRADVVAFPDDDCVYPPDLLAAVSRRLAARPELGGLTGRHVDPAGSPTGRWPATACELTPETVWNRAISYTIFLRSDVVRRVGGFDETLGLGSGTPWHSGEEIEYLVRALRGGVRILYDPELAVLHHAAPPSDHDFVALGARDGASVGYILARHRYPPRAVARMLVRPAGGALVALARRDPRRARFQLATLRGRARGYVAARRVRA
jgi:glycosyltransferase involved in cell wall biosynthesis